MPSKHSPVIEALLNPRFYPGLVDAVEMVETHISYIFFTGKHAYKVKKPVDYGFLDFTTLGKRHYFCQQEVELNRRLSPEVYLDVVEIRLHQGGYNIQGLGRTVEYAVKMRQLPRDRAMNVLLKRGEVSEDDVQRLAVKIAKFHGCAETSPEITKLGGLKALRRNVKENFTQSRKYIGLCLSRETYDDLETYSDAFLSAREELLLRREIKGRVRDCHGDLHTADIFLENGISIIDCIEFNRRFRYSDVAEDIAFLAMDLDFHGRYDLSRLFMEAYVQAARDPQVMELLDFFKAYRAYVRGKVTSFRLESSELSPKEREEILATARSYFSLAHSYTRLLRHPSLILVSGLPGTGKSTVAQELSRRWNLTCISSDVTRKKLADIPADEHRYVPFGRDIYSHELSRRTYDAMLKQAEHHLRQGRSVVLDATFRRDEERKRAETLAKEAGAEMWIMQCSLPDEEVRRRLNTRFRAGNDVSDARWEHFHRQKQEWEVIEEGPGVQCMKLTTEGSRRGTVRRMLRGFYLKLLS